MEQNKDYEKRLGRRLREAYLKDYEESAMSREDFHRLIEAAEKKKSHKKAVIGLAAACVAICLVCGGFIAGMSMRESASAGKDDETKTVQQGGSVVIGSGVSENDQNVGVSTKTYTDIEDIPEDLREQIHFLDSDEFELEKVKVEESITASRIVSYYNEGGKTIIISQDQSEMNESSTTILYDKNEKWEHNGKVIYKEMGNEIDSYVVKGEKEIVTLRIEKDASKEKIEAIFDGLGI